jgi:hypothetical protein
MGTHIVLKTKFTMHQGVTMTLASEICEWVIFT